MDYTKCESASDFDTKFRTLLAKLDVVEGEETWQQIDNALKNLLALVKAGATKFDSFTATMKQATNFINNAVLSERTRLSGTALALIEEMARQMETRFQTLCELLFPTAMKTCGRANKVFVTRGVNCLTTVITYAHVPDQTPRICEAAANDPNKTVRSSAAKLLMSIVSCCTVPELTPHLAVVEKAIADGVVDANPEARTTARQSYEIYIKRFSNRAEQFKAGLSTTAKKYLKIEDKGADAKPQSSFGSFRQRQPLRDRINAQRANAKANSIGSSSSSADAPASATAAAAPHRPKPVRPISRHTQGATSAAKDGVASSAAALTLTSTGTASASEPAGAAPVAAPVPTKPAAPVAGFGANSVEQLLLSPRSTKPTLVRLFGDDPNNPQGTPAAADKERSDSTQPSVSPTASVFPSRGPSPLVKTVSSESVAMAEAKAGADGNAAADKDASTKTEEAPVAMSEPAAKRASKTTGGASAGSTSGHAERPASRAQRSHGLSFSSLSGGNGARPTRTAHAVRPQSRNLVSNRMEEALRAARPPSRQSSNSKPATEPATATTRAQRPAKSVEKSKSADTAPPKRMTLRSDSKATYNLRTRSAESSSASDNVPGYLRATASSAKRISDSASTAARGTKRRKRDDPQDEQAAIPATAKVAKIGARRSAR